MKADNIDIKYRQFDIHADAYLVYGKTKKKNSLKQYVVGWQPRHAENHLLDPHYFLDDDSAIEFYLNTVRNDDQPYRKKLLKDWQQQRVYEWEENELAPYTKKMTKTEITALVKQVAKDHGIKIPKIKWLKEREYSDYAFWSNTIRFGHRDNISVLHEMAHAIHDKTHDREDVAHHPPAFVWTAIELYHRYAGAPLNTLISTAQKHNLLGDLNIDQAPLVLPQAKQKKKPCPDCKP